MATQAMQADPQLDQVVQAVNRRLEAQGWRVSKGTHSGELERSKDHVGRREPIPDFQPIPAKGQPASEIIIEERG